MPGCLSLLALIKLDFDVRQGTVLFCAGLATPSVCSGIFLDVIQLKDFSCQKKRLSFYM